MVTDITERKRMEEELKLLQTVTQAIAEAPGYDSALQVALQRVAGATGWSYGEVWVPGEDAIELSPSWYPGTTKLKEFRRKSEEFTFQPGEGLPGRVWESRKPEWIPDISAVRKETYLRTEIAREAGLKAGLGVPITANGEVLAVLAFYMFKAREEDSRLIKLVSTVAAQLGSVLLRKRAEQEVKRYAGKLEESNRMKELFADILQRPCQPSRRCQGLSGVPAGRGDQ